jgi:hypothetical protein
LPSKRDGGESSSDLKTRYRNPGQNGTGRQPGGVHIASSFPAAEPHTLASATPVTAESLPHAPQAADPIANLRRRHPGLERYRLTRLAELPADHPMQDFGRMAGHMEVCWSDTYRTADGRPKSRFAFTAGYLDWVLGARDDYRRFVHLAFAHGEQEPAGLIFAVRRRIRYAGDEFDSGILTGLSVHPDHKGQGLGQWLHFAGKDVLFELSGRRPMVMWWDAGNRGRGQAMKTFRRRDRAVTVIGKYPMITRIFDAAEAARVLDLNLPARLFAKLLRSPRHASGSGATVMADDDAEEAFDRLLTEPRADKLFQRRWTKDEMVRDATFCSADPADGFAPIYLACRRRGELRGALLGYRIPITQRGTGSIMVTDYFLTVPGVSFSERRAMLREAEAVAAEAFGVFGNVYFGGFEHAGVFRSRFYAAEFPRKRSIMLALSSPDGITRPPAKRRVLLDVK